MPDLLYLALLILAATLMCWPRPSAWPREVSEQFEQERKKRGKETIWDRVEYPGEKH